MATKLKGKKPDEVTPGHAKMLLYGAAGSGKTWFAQSFPDVYHIDTEGGGRLRHYQERLGKNGGAYVGPDEGACDFGTIIGEMKALATGGHKFRTLVIDSITKVYQTTIARESEKLGDKDAFGASKKPAIAAMRQLVSWVHKLDMNVVIVAHEVPVWGGEGRDRKQIGFGPDVWEKLSFELDLTGRVEKHSKGFRTFTVDKSRLLGFPEFERFNLQEGGTDVGYKHFSERFGKDFIEAASKPIVLASVEQVAEIVRLVDLLKIPADETEKVLTKAGAEEWADLTDEQATKTVAWLRGKIEGK